MQFLVQFEVFSTITRPEDIQRVRDEVGAQLQTLLKSGKMKGGGAHVGKRGGVFLLDVGSHEELFSLLGPALLDNGQVQVLPLMPFEKLGEFFAKEKAKKAGA